MVKLSQAANVLWVEGPQPGHEANAQTKHFESVLAAVRFIMEGLPAEFRTTAWVTTEDKSLTIEEIQSLHSDRSVLAVAVNAETAGVTATGIMLILGKGDIAEAEASLGRLAKQGLLTASDESARWFVTDAGRQAASE